MTVSQITPLPPAPQRGDAPVDFVTKADAHVASLTTFVSQTNAVATEMNTAVTESAASAAEALASESNAVTSETNAAQSAADAANVVNGAANYKGTWASQTGAATIPATYEHGGAIWLLLGNIPDITASEPGVSADYLLVTGQKYVTPIPGAILSTVLINKLKTSDTFNYPIASTVQDGLSVTVAILETDKGITPRIDLNGGDNATNGTDTASDYIIYGEGFSGLDDAVSNGVDTWEF